MLVTRLLFTALLLLGLVQSAAQANDELKLYPANNILSVAPTHTQAYGNELLIWRNDERATAIERYLVNDAGAFHLQDQMRPGTAGYDSIEVFRGQVKLNWLIQFRGYTLFAFQNFGVVGSLSQKIRLIDPDGTATDITDKGEFDRKLLYNTLGWFVGKDNKLYSFAFTGGCCLKVADTLSRWDISPEGELKLEASKVLSFAGFPQKAYYLANMDVQGSAYISNDKIWLVRCEVAGASVNYTCLSNYFLTEIDLKDFKHLSIKSLSKHQGFDNVVATTESGVILHSPTTSNILLVSLNNADSGKVLRTDAKKILGYQQGKVHYLSLNNEICSMGMDPSVSPRCEAAAEELGTFIKVEQKHGGQFWFTSNGIYWKQKQKAAILLQQRYSPDNTLKAAGVAVSGDLLFAPDIALSIAPEGRLTPIKVVDNSTSKCSGEIMSSRMASFGAETAVVRYYKNCLAIDALTVGAEPKITRNQYVYERTDLNRNLTFVAPGYELVLKNELLEYQFARINLTTGTTDIISFDFDGVRPISSNSSIYLVGSYWIIKNNDKLYRLAVGDKGTQAQQLGSLSEADSSPYFITGNNSYLYLLYPRKLVVLQLGNDTLTKVREIALPDVASPTYGKQITKIRGNQFIFLREGHRGVSERDRYSMVKFDISQHDLPVFAGVFEIPISGLYNGVNYDHDFIDVEIAADGYLIHSTLTHEIMKWSPQQPALEIPAELMVVPDLAEQKVFPLKAAQAKSLQLVQAPKIGTAAIRDDGLYFTAPQNFESTEIMLAYTNPEGEAKQLTTVLKAPEQVNANPILKQSELVLREDTVLTVTDIIENGEEWQWSLVGQPKSVRAELTGKVLTLTPAANFHGDDNVTIALINQLDRVEFTIPLKVQPINDAPVFASNNLSINIDLEKTYSGQLAATDVDGDPLSFRVNTLPGKGTVTVDNTGKFNYVAGKVSGTDRFTLVVTDPAGLSAESEVTVQINAATVQPDPVQPDPVQPDPVQPEPAKTGSSGGASWWMLLLSAFALCQRMPRQMPAAWRR